MGITGLLPLLKSIQTPVHLRDFKDKTIGIGSFGCALDLAMGKPTTKYVQFCMEKVKLLLHYGIRPYFVFDGGYLPMKQKTEVERNKRRKLALEQGKVLLKEGKRKEAMDCFQKCLDITPKMAWELIKELKKYNIPYIIAPYEADAQLAFLEFNGYIDAIITEDSDLIVFGCKHILYKLDKNGNAIEIKGEKLTKVKDVSFIGWSIQKFRQLCILSGCDYLENIPGLGLKTAYKLLSKYQSVQKLLQLAPIENALEIPRDYLFKFQLAEGTFCHQHVYHPELKKMVPLTPFEETTMDNDFQIALLDYIGPMLPDDIVQKIAIGEIDPLTKKPFLVEGNHIGPILKRPLSHSNSLNLVKPIKKSTQEFFGSHQPNNIPNQIMNSNICRSFSNDTLNSHISTMNPVIDPNDIRNINENPQTVNPNIRQSSNNSQMMYQNNSSKMNSPIAKSINPIIQNYIQKQISEPGKPIVRVPAKSTKYSPYFQNKAPSQNQVGGFKKKLLRKNPNQLQITSFFNKT